MPRWHRFGHVVAALVLAALLGGLLPVAALAAAPTVAIVQTDNYTRQAKLVFSGITDTGLLTVTLSCDDLASESDAIPFATTLTVPLALPGCEGYGQFALWVTVRDGAWIILRQQGVVTMNPKMTIEMPLPGRTGQLFTLRPRYPDDYRAPANLWCRYELRWGNDRSLLNDHDETFGAIGFDARMVDGNCPVWTFTLPWVPYPQFVLSVSVGDSSAWWGGAEVRFRAETVGSNPRILSSSIPIVQVLPNTWTPIVGQPVTYTRHLIGGAAPGTKSQWTARQGNSEHPRQWFQQGGATFTITPQAPGDMVVGWQRFPGSFLYAIYDPPVRYRDRTRPTTTAPVVKVNAGEVGATVPVSLSWTGRDTGWGIKRFELERSVDGGSWKRLLASRSKSITQALAPGHAYRYRVRAVDKAGNVGAWSHGATIRPKLVSDGNAAIRYAGTWSVVADGTAAGGSLRESDVAGAAARLTFTGRGFAWVAERGPGHGRAQVFVDGKLMTTVDLAASADIARRLVVRRTWKSVGRHVVKVVVVGTAGRPIVSVDGFVVIR